MLPNEDVSAKRARAGDATVTRPLLHPHPPGFFLDGTSQRLLAPMLCDEVEDGTRFRSGPDGRLYRFDQGVYRPDGDEYIRFMATGLLGSDFQIGRVEAVVTRFQNRERLNPLSFDPPSGHVIHAKNGILHLSRDPNNPVEWVEPYTHENAWLCQVPWGYVEDGHITDPTRILAAIEDMFSGDRARLKYVLGLIAIGMIPTNVLRRAVLFHGNGRNGKSILLGYITQLYGVENVASVSLDQLTSNRFMAAELCGKLANICGDIGPRVGDTAVFKQATGNDRIQGERKFGQPFTFHTGAMPFFSSNLYPRSSDQTPAFLGRWTITPFEKQFEENAEKEAELSAHAEDLNVMNGLFNLSLCWAVQLLSHPSPTVEAVPESMRQAKCNFASSVNSVQGFLTEATSRGPELRVTLKELYGHYERYCGESGIHPQGKTKFSEAIELEAGIETRRPKNVKTFHGIAVDETWLAESEEQAAAHLRATTGKF